MKKNRLAMISIGLVIITGSLLLGGLHLYAGQGTIPRGTVVAGLPLGGRQSADALGLLNEEIALILKKKVILSADESEKTLTWQETGISFDTSSFRAAVRQLGAGTLWERVQTRKNFPKQWELKITLNEKKLHAIFPPSWEKSQFGDPTDAVRTITPDDQIRYLPEKTAQRVDWERFAPALAKSAETEWSRRLVERRRPGSGDGSGPGDGNASGEKSPGEYAPGASAPVRLVVPLRTVQPKVTVTTLKKEGIRRKIVQFSTGLLTSGAGRIHNVDAAARSIDGKVLAPGEIFDYGKAVEYAEKTYGFREAPVIFAGKLVPGVGGGICQVSSTLYNAAVRAGLDIVERRNHSVPVSYLPKGQDATFAQGHINFRFKNTSGHHLLIRAEVENKRLTVKLFGDLPENVAYAIESRTMEVIPAPEKHVVNGALPAGSKQLVLPGKQGYVVETYRIKKIDGRTVERIRISEDIYPAQPAVIAVGGTENSSGSKGGASDKSTPKQILEDGVQGPNFR
ncbi:vancomycin resistance protein [Paenibacillus oralis]|uniref:Vancomycin resistance protein n=1 Tax=Paenibacillus oralis TaxID=2490856 RepID=A0A3P3TVT6_9BACL|nr:VanW family protein [Paenibacillus oralis]RRJ62241.1 vancomycin resistance protein [Paenibacillus oralis]